MYLELFSICFALVPQRVHFAGDDGGRREALVVRPDHCKAWVCCILWAREVMLCQPQSIAAVQEAQCARATLCKST